jgi:hypothetical protein
LLKQEEGPFDSQHFDLLDQARESRGHGFVSIGSLAVIEVVDEAFNLTARAQGSFKYGTEADLRDERVAGQSIGHGGGTAIVYGIDRGLRRLFRGSFVRHAHTPLAPARSWMRRTDVAHVWHAATAGTWAIAGGPL